LRNCSFGRGNDSAYHDCNGVDVAANSSHVILSSDAAHERLNRMD
jgi:hypothetical protein